MDNFINKFAKRENAQEMIKANAMAELKEKEKLEEKLSEYELAIQEMKRCSLQNIENAEKVKELLAEGLSKIEGMKEREAVGDATAAMAAEEVKMLLTDLKERMETLLGEQKSGMAELLEKQSEQIKELLEEQKKAIEELIHAAEESDHKEAVKVYRNVQAVIEGELPKQTAEIKEVVEGVAKGKKQTWLFVVCILTFLAAAANVAIEVAGMLGYL